VIIVVLLLVWGGVGAWWFLSRPENHSTDSIGTFRHQLRVLERTGPTTVSPAYRMETDDLGVYGASPAQTGLGLGRPPVAVPSPAASRRRRVQKRRREVFYGLVASIVGSVVLGLLPGLSVMWLLAGILTAVLALYVIVLMQLRASAAERAQKVRFLADAQPTALTQSESSYLLRRSAN